MKKLVLLFILLLTQLSYSQTVTIPDANFKAALIADGVDTNNDGEIQVSEAEALVEMDVSSESIHSLEGISSFVNLQILRCPNNNLATLDVSNLLQLKELYCQNNDHIASINVSNLSNLTILNCRSNHRIESLDLSDLINLKILNCNYNGLTSLDVSNLVNLEEIRCENNALTSLNVSGLINLKRLDCGNNQLTSLDLYDLVNLQTLYCEHNQLVSLDLSNQSKLLSVSCPSNYSLETLFTKNGITEQIDFVDCDNLQYVCTDPDQSQINSLRYTASIHNINCNINSFCTFIPGGEVFYVEGNVKLDLNNDGCDTNDIDFGDLKLKITNSQNISDTYATNADGSYSIALIEDSYTIESVLENPSYFNVSPTSFNVNFPADTSPHQQDFCLTANGVVQDLEIQIIPLEQARPGFDADYKIVYKNNGTTSLSGNITLTYQEDVLDFLSATPAESSAVSGQLSWAYTNLTHSESREILFTMNLNTPTDTPPLNDGDILCYEATITPTTNDQRVNDNTFTLKQTIVNSYDPNDKTCLEGNTVTPDLIGEYVHYLIRFENTGSASAVNIVVKDVIDTSKFDISTLVIYDSSHDQITRIQNTNEVEFIFEDINLPFDDANNDGYVAFKIKTLPSLVVGDVFENSAEIYFDYNAPIITNNEQTTIETTTGVDEFSLNSNVTVFPNPTNNLINIQSTLAFDSITIYDLKGRQLQTISSTTPTLTKEINVSNLASGIYYLSIQSGTSKKLQKIIKE